MTVAELIEKYRARIDYLLPFMEHDGIGEDVSPAARSEANTLRKVIDDLSKIEPDAEDNTNHPDEVQGHIRNLFD